MSDTNPAIVAEWSKMPVFSNSSRESMPLWPQVGFLLRTTILITQDYKSNLSHLYSNSRMLGDLMKIKNLNKGLKSNIPTRRRSCDSNKINETRV